MKKLSTLILTEGGSNIGFGHLARCCALVEGLQKVKRGAVIDFVVDGDAAAKTFVKRQGIDPIVDEWVTHKGKRRLLARDKALVIVDSYRAPYALYDDLVHEGAASGKKQHVVAIDDYNRIDYPVHTVVNPSIYGDKIIYQRGSSIKTMYLLGADYIILRKEFWRVPKVFVKKTVKNILVTFGGMEYQRFMKRLWRFLGREFPRFTYHVVTNAPFFYNGKLRLKRHSGLSAGEMIRLMRACDLAISGGGQTLHELARLGIPTIGLCLADNQQFNLGGLYEACAIKYAGWYNEETVFDRIHSSVECLISAKARGALSARSRKTLDGKGVERIVKHCITRRR